MAYQRPDLDLLDRVRIGAAFIDPDRPWGRISDLSRLYATSRETIYTIGRKVQQAVVPLLQPQPVGPRPVEKVIHVDANRIDRALLTFQLEGHAPIRGAQACLEEVYDVHRSIGYIASVRQRAEQQAAVENQQWNYESIDQGSLDEIFRRRLPHLVSVHGPSGLILALEQMDDRSADAWGTVLDQMAAQGATLKQASSDGARGLLAALRQAPGSPTLIRDQFHPLRDLGRLIRQLENQAWGAMGAEYKLQGQLEKAKSQKKGRAYSRRYGQARREAQRRIALYEQTAASFEPLRDALEIVDVAGIRLRSPEEALHRLEEVIGVLARLSHPKVQALAAQLDRQKEELLAYAEDVHRQLATLFARGSSREDLELLCCRWKAQKDFEAIPSPHTARRLAFLTYQSEIQLQQDYRPLRSKVDALLETRLRTTSAVEGANSRLSPFFAVHKQVAQGFLELLRLFLNLRPYRQGTRKGHTPAELAGIERPTDDWRVLVGLQPKRA